MIAVDTSVLVALFRGDKSAAANRLREIELNGIAFCIPAICCQEVLQGARDEREWKNILEVLSTQKILSADDPWKTHLAAARLFFDCRRHGITIRSTVDCFIAALAIEHKAVLLHADTDFERLKKVCALRTLNSLNV
jgi:predicted nucleic acid-binding protein